MASRELAGNRPNRRVDAPFVAVDGESVNDQYVLLAAAAANKGARHIYDPHGLSTRRCLNFLVETAHTAPRGTPLVAFGWNYDVNMLLRDVPPFDLIELWETGELAWHEFFIEWTPGKFFTVKRMGRGAGRAKVFDVWGLFQSSFVRALEAWDIDAPETIARMKGERATFRLDQIDEIRAYCVEECRLLARLMNRVRDVLDSVNLRPLGWHGAGAVAARLLDRERVVDWRVPDDELPDELQAASLSAYYGGRVEAFVVGDVGPCVGYDIRSAYPAAAAQLPALTSGTWQHESHWLPPELAPIAVWHVRWKLPDDTRVCPFPVRIKRQITYPTSGEGWYWQSEVAAARAVYGSAIRVEEGWRFTLRPGERRRAPFAFVPELYNERAEHKRRGLASEKVLKLALNSMYGKLAQGISKSGTPPFRSYVWAGLITSDCRARMFTAAMEAEAYVVAIATDGIVFMRDGAPRLEPESAELGAWERSELDEVFVAQPGVYAARDGDRLVSRTRGFFARELDWPTIRDGWHRERELYVFRSSVEHRRFIGAGSCYVRNNWTDWRTWQPSQRKLSLYPSRKYIGDERGPFTDLQPPVFPEPPVSEPYVPKVRIVLENDEHTQGMEQPLRDF